MTMTRVVVVWLLLSMASMAGAEPSALTPLEIDGLPVWQLARGTKESWYAITARGLHRRQTWTSEWRWVSPRNNLLNLQELEQGVLVSGDNGDCEFSAGASLRISRDAGKTWAGVRIRDGFLGDFQAWGRPVVVEGRRLLVAGCDVTVSDDAGRTWRRVYLPDDTSHGTAAAAAMDARGNTFVTDTSDGNLTWLYKMIPGRRARRLRQTLGATALFIDGRGHLFLADNRGVHRSRDGGASFEALNGGLQELLLAGRRAANDYVYSVYRFSAGAGTCTLLLASPVGLYGLDRHEIWLRLGDRRAVLEAIPTPTGLCLRVERAPHAVEVSVAPPARASRIVCDPETRPLCGD